MNFYQDFPPEPYFNSLLKSHPKTAWLYKILWEYKNPDNKLVVEKNAIRNRFFMSPTVFRNLILPIAEMGLISVDESPNMFVVELTDFDDTFHDQIFP